AQLQVGEYVLAVGNPFGLNQTVTMGIISAVGRANIGIADYEDFIQTDAAINPGNSGGALVNTRGELIGINTAIFSQSGGYMGVGFAVPSEMAKPVMESLVKNGKVIRGWLGVSIQEMTPKLAEQFGLKESKGVLVSDVLPKSPAERAGIKRGDVLLEIDGKPIEGAAQLRNTVTEAPIGKVIRIKRFSDGKESEVPVTIGEQPKETVRRGGTEAAPPTALTGVQVQNLTPEIATALGLPNSQQGVVIDRVESGSLADKAGLQRGDVIVEINRKPVKDAESYDRAVSGLKRDEAVLLLVNRRGVTLFVTLDFS
ncbi:MAG: PDZ domain-containing protein, partial [Candidatus Manganitrophaceae bacterium]